jgi:myo-inositol 2-dehydrogenase/D-chiro-inositol 1-dehydrogenase
VSLAEAAGEVTVKAGGERTNRVPANWRDRFAGAFDAEFRDWLTAVAAGTSTGPGSWDGYSAAVVTDSCVQALRTGQRTEMSSGKRPGFYAAARD